MRGWEDNIRKVVPYVPGEQPNKPGMVKLNTNENPYPPSPNVLRAVEQFPVEQMRLYPDPTSKVLINALAEYYQVDPSMVFVGVGSDDVLAMCFMTFFNSAKPILFPDVTYSFYTVWAELFRIPYQEQPLKNDFHLDIKDYTVENGGIIFPNPNAPTGLLEDIQFIEAVVAANPGVIVIIDEAYIDFGGVSALSLIDKYDNLLVVQTFSKARSMAGMRIGYAIGNPELIKFLNDVKYSFNSYTMNQPTYVYGVEAVKDRQYFEQTTAKIIKTREWTKKELANLGFFFPDSNANFIFASHPDYDAKSLFEELKKNDIYVRYFPKERIREYLRISIGTDEEMQKLIAFLKNYLSS